MITELPRPGSVWFQPARQLLMRVVLSDVEAIVAHNVELVMHLSERPVMSAARPLLMSWSGTPEAFFSAFQPADPKHYPQAAQ